MLRNTLLALASVLALASCKKVKDPEFRGIGNVEMKSLGIGQSAIDVDVIYFNPNSFEAKLKSAEGDAWIDSSFLGHFIVKDPLSIPANSQFAVPVVLQVNMVNMLSLTTGYIKKGKETVQIKVVGTAKAGRKGFYKTFAINYHGQHNLDSLLRANPIK